MDTKTLSMNDRKMLNSLKKVCFIRKKMNTLYGNAGKVFLAEICRDDEVGKIF